MVDPRKVLKELDDALSQQYLLTNQNITEGKNPHIKFSKNGGFTLVLLDCCPLLQIEEAGRRRFIEKLRDSV